ncbi:hypothetical protein GLOIN_2v1716145, partial [Rhizophagus irregularis DAOM 181602=DAOM 197198]
FFSRLHYQIPRIQFFLKNKKLAYFLYNIYKSFNTKLAENMKPVEIPSKQ